MSIVESQEFLRRRFGPSAEDTASDIIDLIQRNHPSMPVGVACEAVCHAAAAIMAHHAEDDTPDRAYGLLSDAVRRFMAGETA